MSTHCSSCTSPIKSNALFCPKCGSAITPSQGDAGVAHRATTSSPANAKIGVVVIAALVVVAVGIYGVGQWSITHHRMSATYRDTSGQTTIQFHDTGSCGGGQTCEATMQRAGHTAARLIFQDDPKQHLVIIVSTAPLSDGSADPWWNSLDDFFKVHTNFQLSSNDQSFVLNGDTFVRQGD